MDLGRRRFLEVMGLAGVAAAAPPLALGKAAKGVREIAEEHARDPAMLIDITRCIGCGACVTACKLQWGLDWKSEQPGLGPRASLASTNWTVVRTVEVEGRERFLKRQCLHCLEPACASACFVKALQKSPAGPVVYDAKRCVGCRYCLMACPFGVPTFQWEKTFPLVSKCIFCAPRLARGEKTACAAACPAGAIAFGRRGDLIREAWRRIFAEPKKYLHRVYGETEAGGTSVMYLSDVDFASLGLPQDLPDEPLPEVSWQVSRLVPPVAVGLAAVLSLLYGARERLWRKEAPEEELEKERGKV